jgi:hypothetical protein
VSSTVSASINIKHTIRSVIAITALAAAFVLPAQASAQQNCADAHSDPTAAQYCPQGEVLGAAAGGTTNTSAPEAVVVEEAPEAVAGDSAESSSAGATLPFTGLDVGILLVAAAILGGSGLLLRRLTGDGVSKD